MKSASSKSSPTAEWLDLNDAARMLGVHFTTLRRWADEGQIPHMRTPGGRRRFNRADLDEFIQTHEQTETRQEGAAAELEQAALAHMRTRLPGFFSTEGIPVAAFSSSQMQMMRLSGRRLLGCLIQYLFEERQPEVCLKEARLIAREYGSLFPSVPLNVDQVLRAFLFFRRELLEVVLASQSAGRSRESVLPFVQRINRFTDEILLEISATFGTAEMPSDYSLPERGKP